MTNARRLLMLAGSLSLAVAVFQAVICFSVPASRYFGAPEELLANKSLLIIAGLVMAVVFGLCGLYAFSGAGRFRHLPLLRLGLVAISGMYILRGIAIFPGLLIGFKEVRHSRLELLFPAIQNADFSRFSAA